ncbi:hypothetical protein BN8_02166 [Fibrisoma limi BUZ 3]|uniref:Uncharacterized protein n=1 Tax=Fibrisoma limi BUZ 3 TaxID=1185876 RepID=I2GGS7_9BACT|nr:hypothetical protein [Fibrisoma limi]CCH53102.1 hypothetical protein BN8_02166 [Fibrisoma limi BUZ 3]
MKNRFLSPVLIGLCLLTASTVVQAKPIWKFSVVVAVEKRTADLYTSMQSKSIQQLVDEQMATVNANFNQGALFKGTYAFQADSVYVFSGPASQEVFRPHPNHTYAVVIDGYSDNSVGGGWWGSNQTIYHSWAWSNDFASGPFGPGATDGLTHEFAHARGAVDLYGMRVESVKNLVNAQTFDPVNSIMNYPYGNIVWDEHTSNLLNETADGPILGNQWITKPFPKAIVLKAVDFQGQPLEGALLELYPVEWFSYSVKFTPALKATTLSNGTHVLQANPFQPGTNGYPWTMRYANFLVKAWYHASVVYQWMPLYDVQNAYYRNGADAAYTVTLQFPAETPIIQITGLNASNFYANDSIAVSFSTKGAFDSGNTFSLHVIDEHNNTFVLQTVAGTEGATLKGVLPMFTATQMCRVQIVSKSPTVKSNEYEIVIRPTQLVLEAPSYYCQSGEIYFNTTGGDGSPITYSAPGIKRSSQTDYKGVVETELRGDPKVIPITATQNGVSVTYYFDLKAACNTQPVPPVLVKPIPDQTFTVNQPLPGSGFDVGQFFADPTPYHPDYTSGWQVEVKGLPPGLDVFAKSLTGSGSPIRVIVGTPRVPGVYTISLKASTAAFPDKPVRTSFIISVVTDVTPGGVLTVLQPTYDCESGAIVFHTHGGDGSPLSYHAPGITRSSTNSATGIVEAELRRDPKPILITAIQGEQIATYLFDFKAYCAGSPPPHDTLKLLPPIYDCASGAFRFNTSGGDGSPVEYRAIGITDWTTDANQFVDLESRTANDVQPFLLFARQSGHQVSYVWDLKAACSRARLGTPTLLENFSVQVLGNPVSERLLVFVKGAAGQPLQLRLTDERGRILDSRLIQQAGDIEKQQFMLNQIDTKILLLHTSIPNGRQTTRIIKQ